MITFLKRLFQSKEDAFLKKALAAGAFIADVRTPAEYATGNVKSSVNIPLNMIVSQLSSFKQNNIILVCRSGNRAAEAKQILVRHGFQHVINGGNWKNVQKLLNQL